MLAVALVASAWGMPASAQTTTRRYAKLPLSFEANAGQTHRDVRFLSRAPGYVLYLTTTEAVVAVEGSVPLRKRWLGASERPGVEGRHELVTRSHYYRGADRRRWVASVPHYREVRYANVYPGVDLVYYGTAEGRLEFDFVVARGADPAAIALEFGSAGTSSWTTAAI